MHDPHAFRFDTRFARAPRQALTFERRQGAARAFWALFITGVLAGAVACEGTVETSSPPAGQDPASDPSLHALAQELSTQTCREELRGCLSSAGGVSDLGQCTVEFEGCFTQATLDSFGQDQLLSECRAAADDCLIGVVGQPDIIACGEVLGECADDSLDELRRAFPLVRSTLRRVFGTGVRTIRGLVNVIDGAPALALNGVRVCRERVVVCLEDAVSDLEIDSCADGLDTCIGSVADVIDPVVDSVDEVLDPLPGPNVGDLVEGTEDCRAAAKDCLVGALDLSDIRACGNLLGACVGDASDIVEGTVEDVREVVEPAAAVTNVVDCTLELTQCIAALGDPFVCVDQARVCALQ
jgi:hypothetical protein